MIECAVKTLDFQAPTAAAHRFRLEYSIHFLRLLVLDFLEEAALVCFIFLFFLKQTQLSEGITKTVDMTSNKKPKQCSEKLTTFPITWLEDQGLCACELVPRPHKGNSHITLISKKRGEHTSAAPSAVMKGDSVLVWAMERKTDLRCPSEIEAEVVSITPHLTVRLIGLPPSFSVKDMSPCDWRVDKMANRITFSRQLDGIRALTGPPKSKVCLMSLNVYILKNIF